VLEAFCASLRGDVKRLRQHRECGRRHGEHTAVLRVPNGVIGRLEGSGADGAERSGGAVVADNLDGIGPGPRVQTRAHGQNTRRSARIRVRAREGEVPRTVGEDVVAPAPHAARIRTA
jgi:hypothetical protein